MRVSTGSVLKTKLHLLRLLAYSDTEFAVSLVGPGLRRDDGLLSFWRLVWCG